MQKCLGKWEKCGWYIGYGPFPVTVTTRIIPFLVGNPYKPLFATVTGQRTCCTKSESGKCHCYWAGATPKWYMWNHSSKMCLKFVCFWFASVKFKSHIFFVEIFFPCLIILLAFQCIICASIRSLLAPDLRWKNPWPPKLSRPRRWSNFSKLRRALADGNDCNKGLWERTVGTEQHKSLGQNPESCLFQIKLSIPNDLMELLLKIINIHLRFSFPNHRGVIKLPSQTMH